MEPLEGEEGVLEGVATLANEDDGSSLLARVKQLINGGNVREMTITDQIVDRKGTILAEKSVTKENQGEIGTVLASALAIQEVTEGTESEVILEIMDELRDAADAAYQEGNMGAADLALSAVDYLEEVVELNEMWEEAHRELCMVQEEIWRVLQRELGRKVRADEIDGLLHTDNKLGEVLFEKLALPVILRTDEGPSVEDDVLEELASEGYELPRLILEYRELDRMLATW